MANLEKGKRSSQALMVLTPGNLNKQYTFSIAVVRKETQFPIQSMFITQLETPSPQVLHMLPVTTNLTGKDLYSKFYPRVYSLTSSGFLKCEVS